MKINSVIVAAFAIAAASLSAAVEPACVFNHDMVLQRDRKVPVWGTATPGEKVSVRFAGQQLVATADANGKWRVDLAPMAASCEPRDLVIGSIVYTNVVVGEVWLASGQSNMTLKLWNRPGIGQHLGRERNGYFDAMMFDEPMVRGIAIPQEISDVPTNIARQTWFAFTPANAAMSMDFSAVAWHFAQRIHQCVKVPVGVICSAWGGSRIEPWIAACGFLQNPALAELATKPIRVTLNAEEKRRVAASKKKSGDSRRRLYGQPRAIYNAMIYPLEPFAFRGVIWYQGESNRKEWERYYDLLVALKHGWSERFENPEMPFYLSQITTYGGYEKDESISRIREEMQRFGETEPNAGCASVGDVGELTNIHPGAKRTVATRLAALALNKTYGMKHIVCDAPAVTSAHIRPDKIVVVAFKNVNAWCKQGTEKDPFELCDASGKFVPAEFANVKANTVLLRIPEGFVPTKVAYMRKFTAFGYLRNEAGLPIFPFVIDIRK